MSKSHESLPRNSNEIERRPRIDRLVGDYFPEDVDFIVQQLKDEEDEINFLYGQLLEIGEDPDEVFARYGITESEET